MEDIEDRIADVLKQQYSEVFANIIVTNILYFVKLCKKHNISEDKLNSVLSQYLLECEVNGVKVPSAKGSKSSAPPVSIGKTMRFMLENIDMRTENKPSKILPEPILGRKYELNGVEYYETDNYVKDHMQVCVDASGRVVCLWDCEEDELYELDPNARRWLSDNGYVLHPSNMRF